MIRTFSLLLLGLLAQVAACGGRGVGPVGSMDADGYAGAAGDAGATDAPMEPADPCADRMLAIGGGPTGLVDCEGTGGLELCGAPMVFRPTDHSFAVSAVLADGNPADLTAFVRPAGESAWQSALAPEQPAPDVAQWEFDGLLPGLRYQYEIRRATEAGDVSPIYAGTAVTQRRAGDPFVFALISDSHIGPDAGFTNQGDWCTLAAVGRAVGAATPDFVLNLGDVLDFHEFGFNEPPPDGALVRQAYRNYRALLGDTLGNAAHFSAIGNWDGEDGWFSPADISQSRQQRLLYLPGPSPATYPQSGSDAEDYYAFTWGDALFVVLNVMSYTPTPHLLSAGDAGAPDDWTLGPAQLDWLSSTLAAATSRWRFLFIHHADGGAAGDPADSTYGRGGGQAAHVGEQARVHQLMLDHGVQIFFYGHDHVFTDMTVDGIHYSEPGSAGAIWMFEPALTGYKQSWLESGWARVAVSPDAVDVKFLSTSGQVIDEYQLP